MLVKIGKLRVDVVEKECAKRSCFVLGFDKGTYSPGRGYTSYHRDSKGRYVEHPVCGTRYYHGCPSNSVCPVCRVLSVRQPGERCNRWSCGGVLVERKESP